MKQGECLFDTIKSLKGFSFRRLRKVLSRKQCSEPGGERPRGTQVSVSAAEQSWGTFK